jgi:cytochrome c oxidase assembly factor CtaG
VIIQRVDAAPTFRVAAYGQVNARGGGMEVNVVVFVPPPELTWGQLATAWAPNGGVLAVVAGLGLAYTLGVRRLHRQGSVWPKRRLWWFVAGLMSILLVTVSAVGIYAATLFWARAVQNIVLLMITPMFLALGAPLTLLRDTLSGPAKQRASRILHSRPARMLTFPLVMTAVLIAPLYLVYLTPLYEASLRSAAMGAAVSVSLVIAGFLYFWTRLRIDPTPRTDPYLVSIAISVAEVIFDGALGLTLWLGPLVAPQYYLALHRGWGPDPRLDQIIGAGVLWIGGDLAGLPFLAAIFTRMMHEDQRHATAIDAELDALEADCAPAPQATSPTFQPESRPPARLWWEDHPELAQRFRRRR